MIMLILIPVIAVGALSLVFGAVLGFSSKKFAVEVDPLVEAILAVLPGVNCGGCGLAGCSDFAEKVAEGTANYKNCPAGGASVAANIAAILGIDAAETSRKVAFIKCNGKDDCVKRNYIYDGPRTCVAASRLATGGNKSCVYSCIGLESCKNACPFDAITIIDSIAIVDSKKCTSCGKCVPVCPKNLVEIVPDKCKIRVFCNSEDSAKVVRANCRAGCFACLACQKACPSGAITVRDNIARIDYEKCTLCALCVNKCPARAIKVVA